MVQSPNFKRALKKPAIAKTRHIGLSRSRIDQRHFCAAARITLAGYADANFGSNADAACVVECLSYFSLPENNFS
jgi:hypothetical protein